MEQCQSLSRTLFSVERYRMVNSVSSRCLVNLCFISVLMRGMQSAVASKHTWSSACLEMWDFGTVSVTFHGPPPRPTFLLPHLPHELGPVYLSLNCRGFCRCGPGYALTNSLLHRGGHTEPSFPSCSAADSQEALLTQGPRQREQSASRTQLVTGQEGRRA